MTDLADSAARERIRTGLDQTLVVEAAAGTGKTTQLVDRVVAMLGSGRATVEGLVAVTFTEKAAGELKLRLRAGLEAARHAASEPAERANLEAALARLEEARVSTIHGFCADLLRDHPVEARVDPQFRVLTEGEAERLHREAFGRWLQRQLAAPGEGVRRALRRANSSDDDTAANRLRHASWTLANWRNFPSPWRRAAFARAAALDTILDEVCAFADMTERGAANDPLFLDTEAVRRLRGAVGRTAGLAPRDDDGAEAALVALAADPKFARPRGGRGRYYAKDIARESVRSAHAELCAALGAFRQAADADLAAALRDELQGSLDEYEALKARLGALDFFDLLVRARDLVRVDQGVRARLQRRLTHFFVDEFQDTDPLQAEILLLLAADDPAEQDWRAVRPIAGKLFLVGDPKQSIYRFRGADVGVYQAVKELVLASGGEHVQLTTSFRGAPSLQQFVNATFAPLMTGDAATLQAEYVPLAAHRAEAEGQPSVIALPIPRPYGVRQIAKTAIERSLPDAVAAFVDWLVHQSGWTVTERERPGDRVPVAPRHICLLFRNFDSRWAGDITRAYVTALQARGLPHLLVGGRSFHDREEVATMRAALAAIEWPDDELAVYATLHGSLFGIGDEALLLYRHAHRALHPFRRVSGPLDAELAPIADALGVLAQLHRVRNRQSIADTIAQLLAVTRAHAGFALRPSGEQVLANVLHLTELARTYERAGAVSFRGFVERLIEDAEHGRATEAPILEEGSEGVRMMTVHKAKGLEFPVVVLADLTTRATGSVDRWVDADRGVCALRLSGWAPVELAEHERTEAARDEAEAVRIAYVAATRARDVLVVPAVGDEPFARGWVSCLNVALYPGADQRPRPAVAPGCPPFGRDTVLERPPEVALDADGVKPGAYARDGHCVVWWDPAVLALGAAPQFGLRQEELLDKRVPPAVPAERLAAYRTWEAARTAARTRGAEPRRRIETATARALAATDPSPQVELLELPRAEARPRGPRFGALVHAVLATIELGADGAAVAAAAALHGRLLGARAEEVAAAADAAAAALAHPLLGLARAARACWRETPVSFVAADGAFIDGVVDLAFHADGEWVVVDFKTGHELADRLDAYRRQVALYARGIAEATGEPARAVLLRI
ncbi:MAG: UvrD-helicase domain-containing protein [Candidatus Binatia bacterium]